MKKLAKKFWLLGLILVLAFGLTVVACGGGDDDDDDSDDDTDDDIIPDDDTGDDDDDDNCDPDVSTPVLDFYGICHAAGTQIDECGSTSNPAEQTINLDDMYDPGTGEGWGVFIQYTDNGCDLGWYVDSQGNKEEVLEGTECGTGSQSGVFFTFDKTALEAACNENPGGTVDIVDSLQLLDTCGFTSEVWNYTIHVQCP